MTNEQISQQKAALAAEQAGYEVKLAGAEAHGDAEAVEKWKDRIGQVAKALKAFEPKPKAAKKPAK